MPLLENRLSKFADPGRILRIIGTSCRILSNPSRNSPKIIIKATCLPVSHIVGHRSSARHRCHRARLALEFELQPEVDQQRGNLRKQPFETPKTFFPATISNSRNPAPTPCYHSVDQSGASTLLKNDALRQSRECMYVMQQQLITASKTRGKSFSEQTTFKEQLFKISISKIEQKSLQHVVGRRDQIPRGSRESQAIH